MLTCRSVNLAGFSLLSTCKLQLSGVIRPDKTLPKLPPPIDTHGGKHTHSSGQSVTRGCAILRKKSLGQEHFKLYSLIFEIKFWSLFYLASVILTSSLIHCFYLSLGSDSYFKTLDDFEDFKIVVGSGSYFAEVSLSAATILDKFADVASCPLFILAEVFAWTAGPTAQPQKSASGPPLFALASMFGLQPPRQGLLPSMLLKVRPVAL